MTLAAGTRLGPYEIVAPLGAGGMGEVWRGRDTRLGRDIAIKVLPPRLADDPGFLARFTREAKTISSLNHPNICTLHDVGHERGLHFLVMELVEGESLAERLQKGALPLEQVLRYGAQIADALSRAHRQGIVHRDLKPANVMITKSGAKLLDFGLARTGADASPIQGLTDAPTLADPITKEGTILGTFQYMAPEQLEGTEADARTDLFALGSVLYEMATGRRAFQGSNRTSLIAAIVAGRPEPISQFTPISPPALDHVVTKCLEKDPDDRWQSAHDVASELQWIADAGSKAGIATTVSLARRRRAALGWIVAAALAVVLAVLGGRAAASRRPSEPPRRIAIELTPPAGQRYRSIALSPDGRRIGFVAERTDDGIPQLVVRDLDAVATRPVEGTSNLEGDWCWSPKGDAVAFVKRERLCKASLAGGDAVQLSSMRINPRGHMAWASDGKIYVAPEALEAIHAIPDSGGDFAPVTTMDHATDRSHRHVFALPDGRIIYQIWMLPGRERDDGIYVSAPGSSERKLVMRTGPTGSGGGNWIYVNGSILRQDPQEPSRVLVQPLDLRKVEPAGTPFAVALPIPFGSFTASADGTIAVMPGAPDATGSLTWFDRTGKSLGTIPVPGPCADPRISPDGGRVAYQAWGPTESDVGLWVYDTARKSRTRIDTGVDSILPQWSHDGLHVVYSQSTAEGSTIAMSRTDGAGVPKKLFEGPGRDYWPMGVTASNEITYRDSPTHKRATDLAQALSIDSPAHARTLLEGEFRWFKISPDDSMIAYQDFATLPSQIFVQRVDGAGLRVQVTSKGGQFPHWRADGKELYYVSLANVLYAVPIRNSPSGLEAGASTSLFKMTPYVRNDFYDVTPDGQRILVTTDDTPQDVRPISIFLNWRN